MEPIIKNEFGLRTKGKFIRWLKEGNTYDQSNFVSARDCEKTREICVENLVDAGRDATCNGDSGE